MKIAQFIDTNDVGGAETMMIRLSLKLKAKGHDVVVFHAGSEYLEDICRKSKIETIMIPYLRLYKSVFTAPIFSIKFAHFLKKKNFNVLHSHLYGPITGSFLGTGLYSIKHIGTLHDVYSVKERIGRGIVLRLAQLFGTQLVSVSEDMKSFYRSYIPLSQHIENIHNGIEVHPEKLPITDPLKEHDNGEFIRIVTVGRMVPLKRQIYQLEAMAELLRNQRVSLFFVGDGPELEKLRTKVYELNLETRVFLLGSRTDVSDILDCCDIFVLASESEGLSCSIVEAMSSGLPCVVSDVGGNSELIEPGKNGFLFEKNDFPQLEKSLSMLIESSTLRAEMGAHSKLKVADSFSIESMLNKYQLLYQ